MLKEICPKYYCVGDTNYFVQLNLINVLLLCNFSKNIKTNRTFNSFGARAKTIILTAEAKERLNIKLVNFHLTDK